MSTRISDYIRPEWIIDTLRGSNKSEVLKEIAAHLSKECENINEDDLYFRLMQRELKASTGAERGFAIPHATLPGVENLVVSVARSPTGVEFGALDSERSDLFFTIVTPAEPREDQASFLEIISAVCRLARAPVFRASLKSAEGRNDMFDVIVREAAGREKQTLEKNVSLTPAQIVSAPVVLPRELPLSPLASPLSKQAIRSGDEMRKVYE